MKLMTPEAMHQLDERSIKEFCIPGILLMEHAAYHLFMYITTHFTDEPVLIICGPGNNGGDGLSLARQLKSWYKGKVKVLMLAPFEKLTEDGKVYYHICQKLLVDICTITPQNGNTAFERIADAKIIVDAIFGTGLSRNVEGLFKEIIEHINKSSAYKLSVDIPSGIDGRTGEVKGIGVVADHTITFALPKLGLYCYPAPLYTGTVEVVDIGIPQSLIEEATTTTYLIDEDEMKALLPIRPMRSNKGTFGKVLVVGGSLGMSGATTLASLAAYKVGCGTVTAGVPNAIVEIMEQKLTEVMTLGFDSLDGHFSEEGPKALEKVLLSYDVLAIGPGIGRSKEILSMLTTVLISDLPCVIDADALHFIPQVQELLKIRKAPTILTPHPGEMSKLTGLSIGTILNNPLEIAKQYATENDIIIVLKMERTVVADTYGNIYINRYGNSGLAKGGSGDVLTGVITGLLAQGMTAISAATLGSYLHAKAGDMAKETHSEFSFLPSDTINHLDGVFKELL